MSEILHKTEKLLNLIVARNYYMHFNPHPTFNTRLGPALRLHGFARGSLGVTRSFERPNKNPEGPDEYVMCVNFFDPGGLLRVPLYKDIEVDTFGAVF